MTGHRWRTAVIGLGKVAAGFADDPVMARHYPYATHAQVLGAHPAFAWDAAVDVSDAALDVARRRWHVRHAVASLDALPDRDAIEVAVIATPPDVRLEVVERLPGLRAVIVEKPIATTIAAAQDFLDHCKRHGVLVQVNLWRRADTLFAALAGGRLRELIGAPQAAFGVYGNGLANNGTHMIDFVRMLLGEVDAVQTLAGVAPSAAGPIAGDVDVAFALRIRGGIACALSPVRFAHYRENGLDVWGERGRLSILQEGLDVRVFPREPNRAMQDEHEIASDRPQPLASTVGDAFFRLYDNVAATLAGDAELCSSGESALRTARVVEAVLASAARDGALIHPESG